MVSRPTTPGSQARSSRRHSRRSSGVPLLSQSPKVHYPIDGDVLPLETSANSERFERLSDCLEELEGYMTKLQQMHESMSDGFNEAFSSFLYGLSMTMWCVDFPSCPSRKVWQELHAKKQADQRLTELNRKIIEARAFNHELKGKISHRNTTDVAAGSVSGDTENDSFVSNPHPGVRGSRIPQLKTINRQSEPSSKRGPNLNQPPRYMRGLFDVSSARSRDEHRISKTTRPRFR
jgi:DASH complex subunit DAM1